MFCNPSQLMLALSTGWSVFLNASRKRSKKGRHCAMSRSSPMRVKSGTFLRSAPIDWKPGGGHGDHAFSQLAALARRVSDGESSSALRMSNRFALPLAETTSRTQCNLQNRASVATSGITKHLSRVLCMNSEDMVIGGSCRPFGALVGSSTLGRDIPMVLMLA